jgi:hypothetical protein
MPKKYTFVLSKINIEKVERKYCLSTFSNDSYIPEHTTKIEELSSSCKTAELFSFLDETKVTRKCSISFIDFKNKNYKCFWDKNVIPENHSPIGCPVKYIPDKLYKTYLSEITKEKYTISENITEQRCLEIKLKGDKRNHSEEHDYYETDGIFCSFNCCMSYINDMENIQNPMYKNSESLLLKIYSDIYGNCLNNISLAPHWRTLRDFGGHLSIEEFRHSFNKIDYNDHGIISFVSLGRLFEDKIKF